MITWKKYFVYQADYQHWANDILFASLDHLDEEARTSPQGLFFDSIHKTMNHMLAVNRNWTTRLRGDGQTAGHGVVLYHDWREFKNALRQEIRDLQRWLDGQPDDFYEQQIHYHAGGNQPQSNWVRDVLTHMMTHMAHHRGQVSAVATRLGAPAPEMDFIYYKRETDTRLAHLRTLS